MSAPLCALGEKSKAVDDEAQLHEAAVDLRGFLELVARRFGSLGALTSREVDQVAHLHRERERETAYEQLDREEREIGFIEYNHSRFRRRKMMTSMKSHTLGKQKKKLSEKK